MRVPIQYALNYPKREGRIANPISFYEIAQLTFEKPDMDTFKCLKLAFKAGKTGGLMPTILNGANEEAVALLLEEKIKFMNNNNFKSVHLKSANGTDLNIELPEGHIWAGGSEGDVNGIPFNANIPTEEVFTLPKKTGVNGIVYSSKPLSYGGNLIDNFSITFKDGKAIDFTAETGYDVLKQMLESDEGAKYLGEVAFVPYNSPISNSKLIFFNTLFDENAACHLAFGRAYESCVKDADKYSEEELEKIGVNNSVIHVDFMIGTSDLEITGINKNGEAIQIFSNGNWAF